MMKLKEQKEQNQTFCGRKLLGTPVERERGKTKNSVGFLSDLNMSTLRTAQTLNVPVNSFCWVAFEESNPQQEQIVTSGERERERERERNRRYELPFFSEA